MPKQGPRKQAGEWPYTGETNSQLRRIPHSPTPTKQYKPSNNRRQSLQCQLLSNYYADNGWIKVYETTNERQGKKLTFVESFTTKTAKGLETSQRQRHYTNPEYRRHSSKRTKSTNSDSGRDTQPHWRGATRPQSRRLLPQETHGDVCQRTDTHTTTTTATKSLPCKHRNRQANPSSGRRKNLNKKK